LLRVGPRSAGSVPGPVCYSRGGSEITVTDADLVLGYLPADYFLGGEILLDTDRTEKAMIQIAEKMEVDVIEAARAIYNLVNSNMANEIRGHVVQKGHDPRDFVLVGGGGAGPVHIADIAKHLGIKKVIIPKFASLYCSVGMMYVDLMHDYVRPYTVGVDRAKFERLNELYEEMALEGRSSLKMEGVNENEMTLIRTADMRYLGQFRELEVPIPLGKISERGRKQIITKFHKKHEASLLFSTPENPVQFISLRLKAIGATSKPLLTKVKNGSSDPNHGFKRRRASHFGLEGSVSTAVYDGDRVLAGNIIEGPAIVEEMTTTVVIPPSCTCTIGPFGEYIIQVG